MKHKRPPVPAIILVLLVILVGGYYGLQSLFAEENGGLSASGSIETLSVKLSSEMGGKIAEVYLSEGDSVQAGDPVLKLDGELLLAQRNIALAGLDSAEAAVQTAQASLAAAETQRDLLLDSLRLESAPSRTVDWLTDAPTDFDQPTWYFDHDEQLASAQNAVNAAETLLADAQRSLNDLVARTTSEDFLAAEKTLNEARQNYLLAEEVLERAKDGGDNDLIDAAEILLDENQIDLDDAQKEYDDQLGTDDAKDLLEARAEVSIAQEYYEAALDRLRSLQTEENSPRLDAADRAVAQAKAMLEQAETAILQAEANLALLDVQIAKLTLYAPASGTILTRNIEQGEFVQPGATLLILADLNALKITVYLPEDRYGEISLGQQATLTVDSFPEETFSATVVYVSSDAEFTPRNVQTVEGRSSTVYAVKLKVDDPEGKLKPGMPADVVFE